MRRSASPATKNRSSSRRADTPQADTMLLQLVMVLACLSWKRLDQSPLRVAFERAMGPITLGILFAVGLKILRSADTDAAGVLMSCLVCVLMLRTRISPLWFMAVAGGLGAFGLINR